MRLPVGLDHVTVGIAELHADVLRLVPLLDDLDALRAEASAKPRTESGRASKPRHDS
jgi:hypothetical protein